MLQENVVEVTEQKKQTHPLETGLLRPVYNIVQRPRTFWLTLGVIALGVLLGLSLASPLSDLVLSIVGVLIHLFTIVVNPLNGLLLWVVSSPLGELYINISLGESIPDLSPARFCAAFLCTLLLAQTAIRKRDLAPITTTDMMGILFMMGLAFSIMNDISGWQRVAQDIFDRYYIPVLVYFLAKNLVTKQQNLDKVLRAVLIFGVYAGLYAIYENQTGIILFRKSETSFVMYADSGLHILRGLLDRSDHFGALFSMVIPVNFYLYLEAPNRIRKFLYTITLGILLVAIYLTYKRTAWLALVVILLVIQWFYPQFRRLFFILLLVALVVLGATWNTVGQSVVVTDRIGSNSSTIEARTDGWKAAINLWARNPLFGYGLGNYGAVAKRAGVDDTALENEHLSILFGAGLIGFVPYSAWLLSILRDSIRLFRRKRHNGTARLEIDQNLIVIFWGVFLGYLINYSTTVANVFPVTVVFYLLTGAIVGSQARFLIPVRRRSIFDVTTQAATAFDA
ncbi:MAG: O-antigen ligase family protein [Chloroflexota bacterium]|nr:O-antigen ligase family protein [Chloroflexota bacterium]